MLPPPAPSACTPTIGVRTGHRPMVPSDTVSGTPSAITAMSELVPPMSMVIRLASSASAPSIWPPITPPAGPDRNSRTGDCRTVTPEATPPRDCISCSGAGTPASRSRTSSRSR